MTSGTSPAMLLVFSLLVEPGDEVILGTPHYPCYPNFIRFCGGVPVLVPTRSRATATGSDRRRRARARSRRARARSSSSSPANPTGAVQSARDAARRSPRSASRSSPTRSTTAWSTTARASPRRSRSSDEAFVLDGFSKRYAMTGFRLGYAIVPPDGAAPAPGDAAEPLHLGQPLRAARRHRRPARGRPSASRPCARAYDAPPRRCWSTGCASSASAFPSSPQGAFYVFADARAFGGDSRELAFELLERAHVGATPGHRLRRGRRGLAALLLRGLGGVDRRGARAPGARAAGAAVKILGAELLAAAARAEQLPAPGAARGGLPRPLERRQVEPAEPPGAAQEARAHQRDARQDAADPLVPGAAARAASCCLVDLPGLRLRAGLEGGARALAAARRGLPRGARARCACAVLLQDLRRDVSEDEKLLIDWLAERAIPVLVALTKVDKLKPMRRAASRAARPARRCRSSRAAHLAEQGSASTLAPSH